MNGATHIPEGFHTATPYLIVKDLAAVVEFYEKAFGAVIVTKNADFKNVEIKIGDSMIMLGEHQEINASPTSHSLNALPPVSIYLYVEDAEVLTKQAITAGARELYPVTAMPYGNHEGSIEDPSGIVWWIATRMESARNKKETA